MSRKKSSSKNTVSDDPISVQTLKDVQESHLVFLEKWGASFPLFCNVPVVQALTYEVIQILNDQYLREVVNENPTL